MSERGAADSAAATIWDEVWERPPVEVKVRDLLGDELSDLRFQVLAGESKLDNRIENPRVQKPGLAFAG